MVFHIAITDPKGQQRIVQIEDECMIGKGAQNEIRLESWRIGKEHARLFQTPSGIVIEDLGNFLGVNVNGRRIDAHYGPLTPADTIEIGSFLLKLVQHYHHSVDTDVSFPAAKEDHLNNSSKTNIGISSELPIAPSEHTFISNSHDSLNTTLEPSLPSNYELEFEWRKKLHNQLLETIDLHRHDVHGMSDEQLRIETETLIKHLIQQSEQLIPQTIDREQLCRQVLNEAIGLGPLEELLEDDRISEIMVNRFDEIYIESKGRLEKYPLTFTGHRAVMGVIERIVAPLGRRIDESSPMVDARLKDGSRVNAIIPPLALKGPCLTIRKFAKRKLDANDLVAFGSLSEDMAHFLQICVESRKNIIVSGGTGSGKTTLLNILSNFIPEHERIITIEDAAELKLHHEHLISLESRPANIEGKGAILIRDLVKNTLRMRPDRIVVGECRGAEALDMLQAMNTGHEGSLTTLHANSPRDALARLETMVLMAGMELPLVAIREQIASAVDLIIQQTRFACGTRLVTHIVEITGMESGKIQLQELFKFVHHGYQGQPPKTTGLFTGCDIIPHFYEELTAIGYSIDHNIFKPACSEV